MRLVSETYKHLRFYNRIVTANGLIWGIFGGFVIGIVLSYYHKSYLGELPRRLLSKGALSESSALTLEQLKLKPRKILTRALKNGGSLRRCVSVANEAECIKKAGNAKPHPFLSKIFPIGEKCVYDFEKMKLFIPEDKKYTAEIKYEQKKKTSPITLVIWIALLAALAVGVTVALPDLLHMLDNFIAANFD